MIRWQGSAPCSALGSARARLIPQEYLPSHDRGRSSENAQLGGRLCLRGSAHFLFSKNKYRGMIRWQGSAPCSARRSVLFSKQDHGRGIPLDREIFSSSSSVGMTCGRFAVGARLLCGMTADTVFARGKMRRYRNIKYFRVQNSNRAFNALRSDASVVIIKI